MLNDWLVLVPADPHLVPTTSRCELACRHLAASAPRATRVSVTVRDHVAFIDCGGNLERILCPSCRAVIAQTWWQLRMGDDFAQREGFRLDAYATPCCSARRTLDELVYDWPAGFGRLSIEATNTSGGRLADRQVRELEQILGTPLRVIYRRS